MALGANGISAGEQTPIVGRTAPALISQHPTGSGASSINNSTHNARFSLRITISTLFTGLLIVVGGVLSLLSYHKASEIIISAADSLYQKVTSEMVLELRATYTPVADALPLLSFSAVAQADTFAGRLEALPMFAAALRNQPSVSAIQVGYPNGDYYIVRHLTSEFLHSRFQAPEGAVFTADQITGTEQGERRLIRVFFDTRLEEISRTQAIATDYDPRTRPWYQRAESGRAQATPPYLFFFIGKVGTTIAWQTEVPGVVIASDVTLDSLSQAISGQQVTESSEVVLVTADGHAVAYRDAAKLVQGTSDNDFRIADLSELGSGVLNHLATNLEITTSRLDFDFQGQRWKGTMRRVGDLVGIELYLLIISPLDELLSEAIQIRWLSLIGTIVLTLLTIPIVWYVAKRLADPIHQLADEAALIRRFDFSSGVKTRSFIREVDQLARAMGMMKDTVKRFLTLINSLSGEQDFDSLLRRITRETMLVSHADGVLAYLLDDEERFLEPGTLQIRDGNDHKAGQLSRLSLEEAKQLMHTLQGGTPGVSRIEPGHTGKLAPLLELFATEALSLIALPLRNRQEELVGVLCLLYREHRDRPGEAQQVETVAFVQALSGFAAVSLETRRLLKMQAALLDAFIKVIAGAIDAKSPYTGGHCQRVPELTRMLAQAANDSDAPPFRDFRLSQQEWEALDIASWLHDCGKVTTPEYVVDKATKLETLSDRIHEVRMRFEVLKRDAEIHFWKQFADGGDPAVLKRVLESEKRRLDEEFAFVADCNLGGEFMTPERVERLRQIAARTWTRTLDDRIGISWEELRRKNRSQARPPPVTERLLEDKPEHLIEHGEVAGSGAENPWGFRLEVPQHKYNRGELYNLQIERGTLTAEERYQINDHIVQTIIMLEKLPYPKHLRDVPSIAGAHHETMIGNGYPRRLTREQMPLTARMVAIADIFEALTASDRPYKKAKPISEALRIMRHMQQQGHIDPDLFELFLCSGIPLDYGRRFLSPEQMDVDDIEAKAVD